MAERRLPQEGDVIVIPRGARIHTMYPGREDYDARVTYSVRVHHMIGNTPRWPGASGYWSSTDDWRWPVEREA